MDSFSPDLLRIIASFCNVSGKLVLASISRRTRISIILRDVVETPEREVSLMRPVPLSFLSYVSNAVLLDALAGYHPDLVRGTHPWMGRQMFVRGPISDEAFGTLLEREKDKPFGVDILGVLSLGQFNLLFDTCKVGSHLTVRRTRLDISFFHARAMDDCDEPRRLMWQELNRETDSRSTSAYLVGPGQEPYAEGPSKLSGYVGFSFKVYWRG